MPKSQTLREFLPPEFFVEFMDTVPSRFLDEKVTGEFGVGTGVHKHWPGEHKYVFNWVILENGFAVGWNENPSRGWSFPVVRMKTEVQQ